MSQPCIHIEVSVYTAVGTGVDVEEFVVTVRYCGRDVLNRSVSCRAGCRLCYDESDIAQPLDDDIGQMVDTVHNSSCTHHLITIPVFAHTVCHPFSLSLHT